MTPDRDCRCVCGKLVAKRTERGLELKCRGCKRVLVVSFAAGAWRVAAVAGARCEELAISEPGQRPSGAPSHNPSLA